MLPNSGLSRWPTPLQSQMLLAYYSNSRRPEQRMATSPTSTLHDTAPSDLATLRQAARTPTELASPVKAPDSLAKGQVDPLAPWPCRLADLVPVAPFSADLRRPSAGAGEGGSAGGPAQGTS